MNFKEIYQRTIKKIGLREGDRYIDSIVKSAINKAYFELSEEKEPVLGTYITIALNGMVRLPSDFNSIESITPELINGEYRKGRNIITDRNGEKFTVVYVKTPEELVNDTDEPQLSLKAQYVLIDYAVSEYYSTIGKTNEATYFMNNYEVGKKKLYRSDNTVDTVQDVTGGW